MDPPTFDAIFALYPTASGQPSELKKKWAGTVQLEKCKDAFNSLKPQHQAPKIEELRVAIASASAFKTTSKSKDFVPVASCLAEVSSKDFREGLRSQYGYIAVRKSRLLLALVIPLYGSALFPGCREMDIWRYWDRLDMRVGLGAGNVLGEQAHTAFIQNATKEIALQSQGLNELYNTLLHHPLLSFKSQGKGNKQIPDPVMGAAIQKLVVVSVHRLFMADT